ncbi:type IV pilus biogenesis/stability protein PilW [Marinobacter sp. SS21]|uniref:type IV pilus biogenesis/stability protein PilW n=1 Tax=Marinobacter sp. SS21 TaxID=2979460 RepID=UPI00232ADFF1|nr:type IV pilus biogenesis/stability protein PilW [Marinobacter sp. SS21]MDC0663301.1 type IV pilus biogenesis/stability protein PilW [Marinobacter sp. SS21]
MLSGAIKRVSVSVLMAVVLAGCVTTTDSRFAREADKEKALSSYVQLATAYVGQGNIDRARIHLDRALELDAENSGALSVMGLVYQSEGEFDLAEASFQRALASNPNYTRGRVFYGAFLFSQQRYSDASTQFRRATLDTGYPERASVFFNLGLTEERLNNVDAAAVAYRRSVELSRGHANSLLALSRMLIEQGNYDQAAGYYNRLTTAMRRNPEMRHSPQSLLAGIRIARFFSDHDRESSLALLLKNEYPDSAEYQQYKVLSSDVE